MEADDRRSVEGERAIAWLNEHWQGVKLYPICSNKNWQVGGVSELRPFSGGNLVVGVSVTPVFPVTCERCAYTMLFNAVLAGVLHMDEYDGSAEA